MIDSDKLNGGPNLNSSLILLQFLAIIKKLSSLSESNNGNSSPIVVL